jgi:hypothetical protein
MNSLHEQADPKHIHQELLNKYTLHNNLFPKLSLYCAISLLLNLLINTVNP